VLGHFGYGDIPEGELADAPAGFALRGGCRIRRDVLPDLERLLAAARADQTLGGSLRGLSCHRSIARQAAVFARGGQGEAEDRAISVAPPGHSEHTTGYALDFAVRPSPNCPDAEACMAATAPYKWLVANAPHFGFEQSFPAGNAQNVKWEPWHWRWVGQSRDAPGAARARFVFAAARARFPANPGVTDRLVIRVVSQPPVPIRQPSPRP
jgi:D-alanyl-D-alanine carboxypeptidase